jgi:hypothetical protein
VSRAYRDNAGASVTTAQLEEFLACRTDPELVSDYFSRFVYGRDDSIEAR